MKNLKNYNRFILFANTPVCVYGHTTINLHSGSGRKFLKLLFSLIPRKLRFGKIHSG